MNTIDFPWRSHYALLLAFAFVLFQSQTASAQSGWALASAARAIAADQKATQDETVREKAKAENDRLGPSAAPTDASLQSVQSAKPAKNPSGGQEHIEAAGTGTINRIPKWTETGGAGTLGDTVAPIFESAAGNVGIGTTNPNAKLRVDYDATFNTATPGGSTGTLHLVPTSNTDDNSVGITFGANNYAGGAGALQTNAHAGIYVQSSSVYGTKMYFGTTNSYGVGSQTRMMIDHLGNVGIGTNGPTDKLHVVGGITTSGSAGGLSLAPRNGSGAIHEWYNPSGTDVRLFNTATGSDVMTIQNGGNVGIGTTSPTSKLYVNGDITASGAINARYQDVAEWVPTTRAIPAGSVVVLDAEHSNHVLPSSRTYDTRVAGVVSASPGVILGEGGAGKVMVATTGRVRVKVDATLAPIRVGDLLVTSDKEGIAMRSRPVDIGGTPFHRPGTLIGKALEPLEKGVGEILVLLSLQ